MKNLIITLIVLPSLLFSSNGEGPVGARSAGLCHASSCLADVWSTKNNQGNLGFISKKEFGAFYENRFFIKELSQSGFSIAIPIKKGTFGFSYSSIGYKLYKESETNLCYGIKLNEKISTGIALHYLNTKIADIYGQYHAITGSVGLTIKLLPQVNISSHVYNPFRIKITNYNNETIPTIFKLGAQYIFSSKVFFVTEAEKNSEQKVNIKGAIEYNPTSLIFIRVGAASYPSQASFGIGINYNNLKIDISSSYHSILGISPQISLNYSFGKSKTLIKQTNEEISEKL